MKLDAEGYIVIRRGRRGYASMVLDRLTKKKPALEPNEIAVKISLTVDEKVFEKLIPEVKIDLKEEHILVTDIDGEVVQE